MMHHVIFIILFTLAFLLESALVIVTLGMYFFVPDRYLIGNKLKRWHLKKSLQTQFYDKPEKLKIINEIIDKDHE